MTDTTMSTRADLPTGTVTFLFTDLEGSTRLWEEHPEAMRRAVARHDQLLRDAVETRGGSVFKTGGDAFCVAFQRVPDALAAALEAQLALAAEEWGAPEPLRARMAVHTGTVEERNGDYFGPTLNRAARLLAIGHGGQTLLTQTVVELARDALPSGANVRDLGTHRLRDLQRPEQVYQLVHSSLPDDFGAVRSLDSLPNNLPLQPTSFIGRERELAELRQSLPRTRLLTLTGSGGSGKTRLALQLAADLLEDYSDGAWVVDLAALTDSALVPQTLAAAVGIREIPGRVLTDTLAEWVKPRRLLLVLDNCEHVVDACAQLAAVLMRASPGLTLLATSREPLGIPGEVLWPVPSLSAPDPGRRGTSTDQTLSVLEQFEAVRLFVDRARMNQPGFSVTKQNAPAVAQICHRLDGIPLAIELAAGRVRVLSPDQIAARLDDRFRLLTGGSRTVMPRHQTLRAAIDWSYELLLQSERILMRRLAVFAGGWTLEAAETVCAGEGIEPWEVLELQAHLIDKSLAVAESEPGGETRYRLLGTIQQYALDRLVEAGETERLRDRHSQWFLRLAELGEVELRGAEQALWLDRLEQEHDNFRAALEWCAAEPAGAEAGLRLAAALHRFWYIRGYLGEGLQWLESALEKGGETAGAPRAKALSAAGWLAVGVGELGRATALYEESLALYRESGDKHGLAAALNTAGVTVLSQGDPERAQTFFDEGLALARAIDSKDLVSRFLGNLGEVARLRGESDRAAALYEESVSMLGDVRNASQAVGFFNLASVKCSRGEYAAARSLFAKSLDIARNLGDKGTVTYALEGLARVDGFEGNPRRAAILLGAADAIRKAINQPIDPADRPGHEASVSLARTALGEAAFATAWEAGRSLTPEQAADLAMEEELAPTREEPAPSGASGIPTH